ncbi:hypothetical protein GCM10009780_25270 [Actinomadura alba]
MVADPHVRAGTRGRRVSRVAEDPQRHAEPDRRLLGHPGQLPAAYHSHNRHPGVSTALSRISHVHEVIRPPKM